MKQHLAMAILLLLAATAPGQPAGEPWLRAAPYADREATPQGGTFTTAVALDIAPGYHVNANPPSPKYLIPVTLTPEPAAGVRWDEVRYPPGKTFSPKWAAGETVAVYAGRTFLLVTGTVADDAPPGDLALRLKLGYQGCSETSCFQPASRELAATIRVVGKGEAAAPANAAIFAEAEKAFAAPAPGSSSAPPRSMSPASAASPAAAIHFEGETNLSATFEKGLAVYLFSLVGFGLLLNLTPCVFPLIPVTMTIFAQQGEHRPLKVLPLAVLYVVGLAATFTLVGVAAALAGESMGVVLQRPWGVLGVVAVLAIMMASTFGAFDIRLPSGAMGRLGARRGWAGALFMGLVMGLVASPCVGPFLIALITFVAIKGSVALGAVSFFATGLGLGIPYLFLGTFTGLINRVPRGGGWLLWTKRFMGMMLAGLILYFIRPYVAEAFFWPLVLAVFLFAAVYLALVEGLSRRPFSRAFWAARLATGAVILLAGILTYVWATAPHPEVQWTPWRPGGLEAAQAEKKPVLLYFGADWCAACREWHTGVFADAQVIKAGEPFARFYVDVTRPEGAVEAFARRYDAINPPAVIVFGRDGSVVKAYRNPPEAEAFAKVLAEAAAGTVGG